MAIALYFCSFLKEISHFPTWFALQTPGDLAFPPPLLPPSFSGVDLAAQGRVILVYPLLVATLAPRRRLQFDLSITRGGFARASAAKVRSLFEGKNRDYVLFLTKFINFIPVVAIDCSTGAINNLEQWSSKNVCLSKFSKRIAKVRLNEKETKLHTWK